MFCDSRCHRLGSSVYKPSTDFGSIDAKHGQGGTRSRLRFQHGGGSHDDRARIQVSRKALSCLLLIAFTAGRITGNIVYVLNPASPVQVFDCLSGRCLVVSASCRSSATMSVGTAGLQSRVPKISGHTCYSCQGYCQTECLTECQMECQRQCHTEYQIER